MAVKLRLTRVGKTKQPQYRIVAADSRSPRDGRFIEIIGQYNPRQEPSVINLDADKAARYLADGAQPTERVAKLLQIAGVELPAKVAAKVGGPAAKGDKAEDGQEGGDRGGVVSDPNTVVAPTAAAVLDHLVRALVDDPDAVRIDTEQRGRRTILEVHVAPGELGRVIGRQRSDGPEHPHRRAGRGQPRRRRDRRRLRRLTAPAWRSGGWSRPTASGGRSW